MFDAIADEDTSQLSLYQQIGGPAVTQTLEVRVISYEGVQLVDICVRANWLGQDVLDSRSAAGHLRKHLRLNQRHLAATARGPVQAHKSLNRQVQHQVFIHVNIQRADIRPVDRKFSIPADTISASEGGLRWGGEQFRYNNVPGGDQFVVPGRKDTQDGVNGYEQGEFAIAYDIYGECRVVDHGGGDKKMAEVETEHNWLGGEWAGEAHACGRGAVERGLQYKQVAARVGERDKRAGIKQQEEKAHSVSGLEADVLLEGLAGGEFDNPSSGEYPVEQQVLGRHFININVRKACEDPKDEGGGEWERNRELRDIAQVDQEAAWVAGPGEVHQRDTSERPVPNLKLDLAERWEIRHV